MTLFEDFVLSEIQKGKTIVGLYPLTDEKIRKEYEMWNRKTKT